MKLTAARLIDDIISPDDADFCLYFVPPRLAQRRGQVPGIYLSRARILIICDVDKISERSDYTSSMLLMV